MDYLLGNYTYSLKEIDKACCKTGDLAPKDDVVKSHESNVQELVKAEPEAFDNVTSFKFSACYHNLSRFIQKHQNFHLSLQSSHIFNMKFSTRTLIIPFRKNFTLTD